MNISGLGASSIQALYLKALQGTSSSSSTDLSSLLATDTGSDTLDISSLGQWALRTENGNPFQADFENLGELIDAGDLEGARSAYAAMQEKLQANQGAGSDTLSEGFAAIGSALASGDASAAKSAWSDLSSSLESFAAQKPGAGGPPPPPPSGLKEDMEQLGSLLDSGDLEGAKKLLATMQERMSTGAKEQSGSSTSGDTLGSSFTALGSALESGDLDTARSTWETLQESLEKRSSDATSASSSSSLDALLLASYLAGSNASWWTGSSTTAG